MIILGIETSCDETAASVIRGSDAGVEVLSNVISSQIDIHKKWGGVVPEVAAREHALQILPVVEEALQVPGARCQVPGVGVDAIAVAKGPGLITSLLVGVETAKTLSMAWNKPLIGVNHIEGHIYANYIGEYPISNIQYPIIILTVSGGHTMLVKMDGIGKFTTLGETRDDAAGEAFDKAAKLMGLGYPGGPAVSAEAAKFTHHASRISHQVNLPRPMIKDSSFDFSFSGLKTALRYALKEDKDWKNRIPEYCHEFQQAVIDVLIHKTTKAAKKYNAKSIMLAGGVAANKELRGQLGETVAKLHNTKYLIPNTEYTTDNAAMIAAAGYFKAINQEFTPWPEIKTDCNYKI